MTADYITVTGDYITVTADYITVTGDYITVTGDYITVTGDYITVTGDYNLHTLSVVLPQADRSHWATNQLNQATCRLYGLSVYHHTT